MTDPNCLSHWFPILAAAGVPVPRTEIIHCEGSLIPLLDGEMPDCFQGLVDQIATAAAKFGYPCFLRTGHTSGKHRWKDTCYLTSADQIGRHVASLVEFGELVSMCGLPTDVGVVREFLPGPVEAICPRYRDMPVRREFRFFVREGNFQCLHDCWPVEALNQGGAKWPNITPLEFRDLRSAIDITRKVALAFPGYWSVDLLWADRGWYVTDMARGDDSWHWPGCEHRAAE